jgi:dTDP-4-amino-4,6-dideoxygalactose transaminase
MDPAAVEAAITPRTKAMVVVHAFGQPADMDPLLAIAKKHNLYVIEDSCEALGSQYKGRSAGTFGHSASFAYYPNKVMTTGEGGIVVTDNDDEAALFFSLRNQGRDVFNEWLQHTRLGYNYRMDELSAALGVAQMQRIDELIARRAQVAAWYNERLDEMQGIYKPHIVDTTTRMSWFVYVVRCEEELQRDVMMKFLQERGVASRPYFTPIHLQPFYQDRFGTREGSLPNTEQAGRTFLALPFSSVMTEDMVDYVGEQLRAYITLRK